MGWSKIIAPIQDGDLVVGTLLAHNTTLLIKWWWRLMNEKRSLWKVVIESIHNLYNTSTPYMEKKTSNGVRCNTSKAVKSIYKLNIDSMEIFNFIPGYGVKIVFWKDAWCGKVPFQTKFSHLYSLESIKCCLLEDHISRNGFSWMWRYKPIGVVALKELHQIYIKISNLKTEYTSMYDFNFTLNSEWDYIVNAMRMLLKSKMILFKGKYIC